MESDDEEFEPIETSADVAKASSYNWDSHNKVTTPAEEEDFFSTIAEKVHIISQVLHNTRCVPTELISRGL